MSVAAPSERAPAPAVAAKPPAPPRASEPVEVPPAPATEPAPPTAPSQPPHTHRLPRGARHRGGSSHRRRAQRPEGCWDGALPCRRTPDLAGPARAGQEDAPLHLDPAQPERPGDRGRRDQPDRRLQDRRRARLLRGRWQRGDPAPGGDRHDRGRLEDRGRGRPLRSAGTGDGAEGHPAGCRADLVSGPAESRPAAPTAPPSWATDDAAPADEKPASEKAGGQTPADKAAAHEPAARKPARAETIAAARSQSTTRPGDQNARSKSQDLDADAHRDDPSADDNGLDSTQLLERELGATVIEEIPHD